MAGHKQTSRRANPSHPEGFVGLFRDDLDNAGNECLDWQYRYLWDYTRDGWFPAIRMLGYWYEGHGLGTAGRGWTGGEPRLQSTFRKVFRVADLMRTVGADVYHRDWGWWDRAGDWNGPDFRTTGDYLRKQAWASSSTRSSTRSTCNRRCPRASGLAARRTLDMSRPEVVDFIAGQLDELSRAGATSSGATTARPPAPGRRRHAASGPGPRLPRDAPRFLDATQVRFQAVNGGGNNAGYD